MSAFDDRKNAAEKKFALDAEQEFKAQARRNKLLGHWAADLIGRDDKDAYATEVITADFEEAGDDDVFRKVRKDLTAAGTDVSDSALRAKMDELLEVAREQVAADS